MLNDWRDCERCQGFANDNHPSFDLCEFLRCEALYANDNQFRVTPRKGQRWSLTTGRRTLSRLAGLFRGWLWWTT